MSKSGRFVLDGWSKRLGDLGLAVVVIAVVIMMVVPLSPWLVDGLIAVNLGFSVLLLSFSLFITNPVSFTVFPTLLLVATLYRLALNIASTRLILIKADAGQIISAFGGYIVGRDILIGAVIFGILAMVLFLVITKGAERVAEVAARFSLDALPGMQLAIDSDLRLGAVSQREAVRRREALDEQSRYFGALDGAMKFVRGDAIAGLLIIVVNIIGGVLVGTLRHGLSVGAAVDTYGRLTVGDGLVTMIPALLISTAAGLLVTRIGDHSGDSRLGQQVSRQLAREPRALLVTALLLIGLAFVRGLPAWPFLLMSALILAFAIHRYLGEKRNPKANLRFDDLPERLGNGTTRVEMGATLYQEIFASSANNAGSRMSERLINRLRQEHGIPIVGLPVLWSSDLEPRTMVLRIRGGVVGRADIRRGMSISAADEPSLKDVGVSALGSVGRLGCWIRNDEAALVRAAGLTVFSGYEGVFEIVFSWLRRELVRLIGVDEVQVLLDRLAAERPVLVRETVPKKIDLPTLTGLLGQLAEEGIHLDLLPEVLETVVQLPVIGSQSVLIEDVRVGLAAHIVSGFDDIGKPLDLLVLDEDVVSVLESSLVKGDRGSHLAMAASDVELIISSIQKATKQSGASVLMTNPHLRLVLSKLLRDSLPALHVIKTSEIGPSTKINIVAEVTV